LRLGSSPNFSAMSCEQRSDHCANWTHRSPFRRRQPAPAGSEGGKGILRSGRVTSTEETVAGMNDVIVADDNPLLVSILSEIFREREYTVRTASDGFAALLSIRERVPDILISDLNMPRMSGFELLSIVRRRFPSIAVIAMSGAYSGMAIPQGIAADAFYAKASSSVAYIFEVLGAIENHATRHSLRAATPIWTPCVSLGQGGLATVGIACPECLRPFSYRLRDTEFFRTERNCPHCNHLIELAIVGAPADTDRTGPGNTTKTTRTGASAYMS